METLYVIIGVVLIIVAVLIAMMMMRSKTVTGGGEDDGDQYDGGDGDWIYGGAGNRLPRIFVEKKRYEAAYKGKGLVTARAKKAPFDKLKKGDPVVVARSRPQGDTSTFDPHTFKAEVVRSVTYNNLPALLKAESKKVLLGEQTAAEFTNEFIEYRGDASTEVVAIELERTD